MSDAVSAAKVLAGGIAAVGAVPAAVDAIEHVERSILGVPQSVLLVAIVGTLIGVLLLPERDADRITPDPDRIGRWARFQQMAVRLLSLGVVLLGYAFVAAWLIALAATWFPSLAGAPQLPLAGISGVLIRRMLPRYLQVAERITGAIGGKTV